MLFKVCNGLPTFQRFMQADDLVFQIMIVYLDDILVYSSTFWEHLDRLDIMLKGMQDSGLKVKLEKCPFLQSDVAFLGHRLSAEGISTDPQMVAAVLQRPVPSTLKDLRLFLGLCNYYRWYIQGFSKIAGPLHDVVNLCVNAGAPSKATACCNVCGTKGARWLLTHSKRS